ncbi:helix-turn-helix domain-containing protein [Devosia sp. RR2S18]|uniref:helix-turn-helix domain-containing protein n=1 Tax=Devosia rhizosphaerae TaxID=3049774 RepID=UPI00254091FC|nr:helix-turn-helix transcriptional regulator [Devosia sp. RR2S18]WIJ25061.1 helix-turn-helix transcriptional regulator [Devosia sp. RR2S18]
MESRFESHIPIHVTSGQIRAARAFLGWSREEAASACGVSRATLARLEQSDHLLKSSTLASILQAFEARGVVFFQDQWGCGVALRHAPGHSS